MNILLSAYECDPTRGSEYGRSWSWVMDYSDKGFNVYCLTSVRGNNSIKQFLKNNPLPNVNFFFVEVPTYLEERYGTGTLWTYGHYLVWLRQAYRQAKSLLQNVDFDFAHHVSWGSLQLGTFLWRLDIPYAYGPVGGGQYAPKELKPFFLEGWSLEVKREFISEMLLKFNRNTKKGIRKAQCILAVNEDTKRLATKLGGKRIQIVVDTNLKKSDLCPRPVETKQKPHLKLIWVGRLLYRKGLPLVLQAMAKIDADLPISLSIYGDGPFGEALPTHLKQLNIENRANWYGQVPMDTLKQAYLGHDVFVFCTLRESLGVQFFEAMAHGLPVIALDIHGAKTAIPDTAGIKLPLAPAEQVVESLAGAIETFYYKKQMREDMSRQAFNYVSSLLEMDRVENVMSCMELEVTK